MGEEDIEGEKEDGKFQCVACGAIQVWETMSDENLH